MDLDRRRPPFGPLQPVDPIPFPPPVIYPGVRHRILYTHNEAEFSGEDALMQDHRRIGGSDLDLTTAYLAHPLKQKVRTVMGHLQMYHVLRRDPNESEDDEITFRMTEEVVVIKVSDYALMEARQGRYAEDPRNEVAAMQLIGDSHPNVIGCKEVLFDGRNLNVVLPYVNGGSLLELLFTRQQNFGSAAMPEGVARFWFRQICEGLRYLHGKGICHRDLSPENIMIDGNSACLIIDMGMALRVPYSNPLNPTGPAVDIAQGGQKRFMRPQGACGKMPYMSPEIHRNTDPFDGGAIDVWTAGIILFQMLTGRRSYKSPQNADHMFPLMTSNLPRLLRYCRIRLSDDAVSLLQGMIKVLRRERLTLDEVMEHAWFTHPDVEP